ncbi:hypothetical protein SCLCIDRAFT_1225283 [Scleroderma citrinum Foug A]|uniref:Uncharacterized protein n=1 Tax=Scleroderma citrinum Foug A TaxID=1036808 RepID=A0A0C2YLD7_9AGAM|nr:hypothetical protein SCLCIDRAFT_1225283 [Scleroderma citrinum Foug A]
MENQVGIYSHFTQWALDALSLVMTVPRQGSGKDSDHWRSANIDPQLARTTLHRGILGFPRSRCHGERWNIGHLHNRPATT